MWLYKILLKLLTFTSMVILLLEAFKKMLLFYANHVQLRLINQFKSHLLDLRKSLIITQTVKKVSSQFCSGYQLADAILSRGLRERPSSRDCRSRRGLINLRELWSADLHRDAPRPYQCDPSNLAAQVHRSLPWPLVRHELHARQS